ncbi:LacI family transcriptional regulator [Virgibacillus profundi]|uniref:LacI family transcriptional regulator n=1 Tax=Virgibacillus profundi TaxID=2024555 RepID=A0A2A2IA09_9BACI|nr:LacI family DNA-binding transcriptional regulator [Virgibacillus profundi]PAV28412.1 LacI family transcriptional regulator [Virgibacillus profundi]PXY52226.1 LacI family transcriptional regulator [Virgibacillus profundi]
MKLTIKEIAKKANVSITTVSRVLNQNKEGVGKETRKRVEEVIKEYNYRPNAIARSMITKNTKTIGLVIPDIRNPFFSDLARAIEDIANKMGYSVFLCNVDNQLKVLERYLWLLIEKNVDGIIFSSSDSNLNDGVQKLLKKNNIPVMFIDRGDDDSEFNGVFIDNTEAGYLATSHLIKLGHKKIGCITGPKTIWNSNHRLKGYKLAHEQVGLKIDRNLVREGSYTMKGGYDAAKVLLRENKDITSIFALNDLMAFGVYQAARELNILIPDDISVVGFDNLSYNQILTPRLTTIEQPIKKIGEVSVEYLIKQIEQALMIEDSIYLKTKLIVRDSTRAVSKD